MHDDTNSILTNLMAEGWARYRKTFKRSRAVMTEESIHDLRVSIRRLQATVDVVRLFLPDSHTAQTRRELKEIRTVLGPLRDLQVQILQVAELTNQFPDLLKFQKKLLRREAQIVRKLTPRIKSRHARLEKKFSATFGQSHALLRMFTPIEIDRTMSGAVDRTDERVIEMKRAVDRRDTSAIHRLRVQFKKLRYVMETAQSLVHEISPGQLKRMHEIQVLMGSIQDAEVLFEAITRWGRKRKKKARHNLGAVYETLAQRRRDSIAAFLTRVDEIPGFWEPRVPSKERTTVPVHVVQEIRSPRSRPRRPGRLKVSRLSDT